MPIEDRYTSRRNFLKVSAAACAAPVAMNSGLRALGAPVENEVPSLPAGETLSWGKEPIEAKTSQRATICLNGIWRVMPAIRNASKDPDGKWGYIRVPGSWQPGENRTPGLVAEGSGDSWQDFHGDQLDRMWYERPIHIPSDWTGRTVLVEFLRVSTDARVFVNDQECGELHWPEGTVDITHAVVPGQEATLRLLVVATSEATAVESLLAGPPDIAITGSAQSLHRERRSGRNQDLASRGIVGDVFLHSRPAGAHVDSIYVRTSYRKKELTLEVELMNVQRAGTADFTAMLLDENGREERRFQISLPVHSASTQKVQLSWPWRDSRLWDLRQPNLYTLLLKVQSADIADEMKQRFGFREFWIDGRKMFLNGKEFRWRPVMGHSDARPVVEEVDGTIDAFMAAGYNFQEMWPHDEGVRGEPDEYSMWFERADLKGWPTTGVLEDFTRYASTWSDLKTQERYRAAAALQVKRFRNHPSVILWNTTGNYARGDEHPRLLGNRAAAWNTLGAWTEDRFAKLQEGIEVLRSLDGDRPIMSHHCGAVGDVYNLNLYLDFIPLQEREEWLSYWAQFGDMPFFCPEFGAPLQTSYHRGRDGFGPTILSEPLVAEYCAIYFGSQAYAVETAEYREQIRKLFRSEQTYASWQDKPEEIYAPNFQQIQELFLRNTWRSWRTMGNTGGMYPWSNGHGWMMTSEAGQKVSLKTFEPGRRGYYFPDAPKANIYWLAPQAARIMPGGEALVENNQPTLAWICGPGGLPNPGVTGPDKAFTAKDHNFTAGQTIQKQVAIVNDTRLLQKYSVRWEAYLADQKVSSGAKEGTIDFAQNQFVSIEFDLPAKINGEKIDGRITMSAEIGEAKHQDNFTFRAFAQPATHSGDLPVYDPAGQTTELLRKLGYTTYEWDQRKAEPLIVIGRSALMARPVLLRELEPFVRHGAKVIVFIQDPEFMRNRLGLRVAWHMSRRVFPISASHPVVNGLDATDLSDWAGSSTLLEAYPNGTWEKPFGFDYEPPMALYGWRWGGRGAVSSATVEKPHKSSWRPILEDQFDLAYSPLMELDYGKGRLTWCMLDLEDHSSHDPAALRLAGQLLNYVQNAPLTPKGRNTIYIGDDAGARLLDDIGLLYDRSEAIAPNTELLVIGQSAQLSDDALSRYIQGGGKALVLPRSGSDLPLGAKQTKVDRFHGSLDTPNWPEARGLSQSDLRWRTDAEAWLIAAGAQLGADGMLGRKVLGNGVLLYCQLDPNRFDANIKTYFRLTRWRQTRALCQVLANLGGQFEADKMIFTAVPAHAATDPWSFDKIQQPSDFYCADYRNDYAFGDDPYRYYNW